MFILEKTHTHTHTSNEEFFQLVEHASAFLCWPLARMRGELRRDEPDVSTSACLPVGCQQCQLKRGPARKPHRNKTQTSVLKELCTVDFIKFCIIIVLFVQT